VVVVTVTCVQVSLELYSGQRRYIVNDLEESYDNHRQIVYRSKYILYLRKLEKPTAKCLHVQVLHHRSRFKPMADLLINRNLIRSFHFKLGHPLLSLCPALQANSSNFFSSRRADLLISSFLLLNPSSPTVHPVLFSVWSLCEVEIQQDQARCSFHSPSSPSSLSQQLPHSHPRTFSRTPLLPPNQRIESPRPTNLPFSHEESCISLVSEH